jgi:hypothetical protein
MAHAGSCPTCVGFFMRHDWMHGHRFQDATIIWAATPTTTALNSVEFGPLVGALLRQKAVFCRAYWAVLDAATAPAQNAIQRIFFQAVSDSICRAVLISDGQVDGSTSAHEDVSKAISN